jgi:polyisoprenoid-binding protein YceI
MRRWLVVSLAAGAILSMVPLGAMADTYVFDPAHTNVGFKVRHFFTKVAGRFTEFSGTIEYDPADPTKSTAMIEIDATSIDTGNEMRDKDLRSSNFFDVEKHPKITFEGTGVKKVGDDRYTMTGDLTMRGVTKPVTLTVDVLGFGPDLQGGRRGGFSVTTTIDRTDFGVSWNKALEGGGFLLGNEVEILIEVEAVMQKT